MRYQCQCYRDERILSRLSSVELENLRLAANEYLARLEPGLNSRAPASTCKDRDILSVVLYDGSVTTAEGPSLSLQTSKDAFFTIEARDLNECLRIVSQYPLLSLGGMEIRPG